MGQAHAVTVTAIMPAYNAAPVISDAIRSVVDQSYRDWELIVVDDGSTDDTPAIVQEFRDTRIRLIRIESNRGRGAARNLALEHARGEFIAMCDADDVSLANRFELQAAYLADNTDVDVVASQLLVDTGEGEAPKIMMLFPATNDAIQARFDRGRMGVPNASAMVRKVAIDRVGGYCEECRRAQDKELFMRMRSQTKFATLDEPLVIYRYSSGFQSIRKLIENTGYGRYATYRATCEGTPLSYREFMKSWRERLHMLRTLPKVYAVQMIQRRSRSPRALR